MRNRRDARRGGRGGGGGRVGKQVARVMRFPERPPVRAVHYDREGGARGVDSGYLVVFDDAPMPGELEEAFQPRWLCFDCLLDEHPEVGVPLDLAREVGEVWADGVGSWK